MGIAIKVDHVTVRYKLFNQLTVKTFLSHRKTNYFTAVNDMSFSVEEGEIIGIIGKNGSGKSTLLKAIAGIFSPDEGKIYTQGRSVSLLSLGVGFQPRLTGRENIVLNSLLLGFSEKQVNEKMEEIINFADIGEFIDRPINTYSSGMQAKLAFSITSVLETDIMLIDEVLSVGDSQFQKKSFEKMKSLINDSKRTVLIVSHSEQTIKSLCSKVLWINDGKMKMFGDPETVFNEYRKQ